jgi:hypothetical protein
MWLPSFGAAEAHVVDQRILTAQTNVRIPAEVITGIEERVRTSPLQIPVSEKVEQRVDSGLRHVSTIGEVILGVEQQLGPNAPDGDNGPYIQAF